MKVVQPLILLAAMALLLHVSSAQAAITHYNVDFQTKPLGPAVLGLTGTPTYDSNTDIVTYPLSVTNTGATTLTDVRFLLQFVNADNSVLTFNDATDTWSDANNTYSFITSGILTQGGGGFPMSDTDAPLTFPAFGSVAATDTVPQVLIGNLAPAGVFNFTVQANSTTGVTEVVGSFVATPEPSSIAILTIGSLAIVAACRYRKQK